MPLVRPLIGTYSINDIITVLVAICFTSADVFFDNVFVPEEQRMPLANDFASGPARSLFLTRIIAGWIALGAASGAFEEASKYTLQRKQFGAPLASFQLTQAQLMEALSLVQSMTLTSWRISTLYDADTVTYGQIGLAKTHNTTSGRRVVSLCRNVMGGNGVLYDYGGVARAFIDMEAIHTYEGAAEINLLIAGRELTNLPAFKPSQGIISSKI